MKELIKKIEDGIILVVLSKQFYEQSAVYAASYKMTDKYSVMVKPVGDRGVGVTFEPKKQQTVQEMEAALFDFCNELLDQQVRLDLEKRFGKIRELIVEHAFSPLADLRSRLEQMK